MFLRELKEMDIMLFITGDCDKDYTRFQLENFPQQLQMTKDDYVIVCGNFGAVWYGEDDPQKEQEERELDWLESLPFTILFLDGNGDNFEQLNKYPEKEWNGGRVHEIRPSILYLIRGEVFELCGKKIFAFGGSDYIGVGDDFFEWDEEGTWKKEACECEEKDWGYSLRFKKQDKCVEPTKDDIENAIRNLEKHDYKIDYMVTFTESQSEYFTYVCCERGATLGCCVSGSFLTDAFDEIAKKVSCDRWFVGHHHRDIETVRKVRFIYKDFVQLA